LVIVNPNNPTGSCISPTEWDQLKQVALAKRLSLICDEVFVDYYLGEEPAQIDPALSDDLPLFLLNGLSKLAGLPQVKLGWIGIRGPANQRDKMLERLEIIADTYLSVSAPIQHAGPALLQLAETIRSQIQDRIRANYKLLHEHSAGSSVECLLAQGGWYATLRLPRIQSEEEWVLQFLESANTLVHPGYFYDFPNEAYVVISLLPRPDEFREGVSRLLEEAG
jgi:aspartate/methionine/tyrosine aminotransferase